MTVFQPCACQELGKRSLVCTENINSFWLLHAEYPTMNSGVYPLIPWKNEIWLISVKHWTQVSLSGSSSEYYPAFYHVALTVHRYPLIFQGGERHCKNKVSCQTTQHNWTYPGQLDHSVQSPTCYTYLGHRASDYTCRLIFYKSSIL